jgi:hypothetical protein
MSNPSLPQLTDEPPEITVEVAGKEYGFSELPLADLAKLQGWIEKTYPHPVQAIRPHMEGLPAEDRHYLLEQARQSAPMWPPEVGTKDGSRLIMSSPAGQVEALFYALNLHHPGTTREDAERFYRAFRRESTRRRDKFTVMLVFATIFGNEEVKELSLNMEDGQESGDDSRPKNGRSPAATGPGSAGISSSGRRSNA